MDLHFSIANFANIAKAKQLVEMIIFSCLSGLYVLGHHHRLLLHYQHDDRSFRPPESLWAWPSWLHWHQHGSEQGAKRTFVIFFGTNKSSFIYKDFTWKNEGTDNHQETVDKAERIGKPCEADGAPEGFGDYHNLPPFLRIVENQSLCWVRFGDHCNASVLMWFFCQLFIMMICFVALWDSKFVISLPYLHINIPGRLRQSGPVWARVCEGRMSSEAVKEGLPAADVLPGELLIIHFFFVFIYLVSFLSSTFSCCSSSWWASTILSSFQ